MVMANIWTEGVELSGSVTLYPHIKCKGKQRGIFSVLWERHTPSPNLLISIPTVFN